MQNASVDRFLYWPSLLAVSWPLLFVLVWSGPFYPFVFFLVPVLVLVLWAASGGIAVFVSIAWIYEHAWRRLLSTLVLPLSVLAALLNFNFVWDAGRTAGSYVHLFAMYPYYLAEIAALPADGQRFVVWDWGGFTRGYGVAYDESDEIASDHPSEIWKEKADQRGVIGYGYDRAIGHFYFVDTH